MLTIWTRCSVLVRIGPVSIQYFNSPTCAKVTQMVFPFRISDEICVFVLSPFHAHNVSHTHSAVKISSLVMSVCNAFVCSPLGWKIYSCLLKSTSLAFTVVSKMEVKTVPRLWPVTGFHRKIHWVEVQLFLARASLFSRVLSDYSCA